MHIQVINRLTFTKKKEEKKKKKKKEEPYCCEQKELVFTGLDFPRTK